MEGACRGLEGPKAGLKGAFRQESRPSLRELGCSQHKLTGMGAGPGLGVKFGLRGVREASAGPRGPRQGPSLGLRQAAGGAQVGLQGGEPA